MWFVLIHNMMKLKTILSIPR